MDKADGDDPVRRADPGEGCAGCGLIDEIVDGDLAAAGVAFARKVLAEKRPLTRARDRDDKLADLRADPEKFDAIVAANAKRARGLHAPAAAIEALRLRSMLPVDEALEARARRFHAAARRRSVESAAPHFLCRARGGEDPGLAEGREAARDQARRRDRRRHHGRRHRHVLRQCRHSGHDRRDSAMRSSAASTSSRRTTRRRRRAARSAPKTSTNGWR